MIEMRLFDLQCDSLNEIIWIGFEATIGMAIWIVSLIIWGEIDIVFLPL